MPVPITLNNTCFHDLTRVQSNTSRTNQTSSPWDLLVLFQEIWSQHTICILWDLRLLKGDITSQNDSMHQCMTSDTKMTDIAAEGCTCLSFRCMCSSLHILLSFNLADKTKIVQSEQGNKMVQLWLFEDHIFKFNIIEYIIWE